MLFLFFANLPKFGRQFWCTQMRLPILKTACIILHYIKSDYLNLNKNYKIKIRWTISGYFCYNCVKQSLFEQFKHCSTKYVGEKKGMMQLHGHLEISAQASTLQILYF